MSSFYAKSIQDVYLSSQLYDSIEDSNFRAVQSLLLEKGANPNILIPTKGISPFHLIIGNEDDFFALNVTKLILQCGGNPNVRSDEYLTPVHIAAAWNKPEVLQLLLACGGDPELKDEDWLTPIDYAYKENNMGCLNILRSYLPDKYNFFNKETKDCYKIVFDKIIVNNGQLVGEYKTDNSINRDSNQLDLSTLPKSDHTKLVLNWFDTHPEPIIDHTYTLTSDTASEHESSLDESENESHSKTNILDLKFKKSYRKKRKTKKEVLIQELERKILIEESGISTLTSNNSLTDNHNKLDECDSDYMTCSTPSVLNRNIFAVSNVDSTIHKEENYDDTSDLSFVTVSEMYRYEDVEKGVVLYEKRSIKVASECNSSVESVYSKISSLPESFDYDPVSLRRELTILGFNPGPITVSTKRLYLKKLYNLKKRNESLKNLQIEEDNDKKVYSPELEKALQSFSSTSDLSIYKKLDEDVSKDFNEVDYSRKRREGYNKNCFSYLLLDPRKTRNLPGRADGMELKDVWKIFLSAIFYVGKGQRTRPYAHLYDAVTQWRLTNFTNNSDKIQKILDIWKSRSGVICLHIFQNVIPVEAYTREAAMISALTINNITNQKQGDFYGVAATWSTKQKQMFGTYLLYKAMKIFLSEGERELYPEDI